MQMKSIKKSRKRGGKEMKQQELFPDAILHHRKKYKKKSFKDCPWYGKGDDDTGCGSSLWGTCLKKYDCGIDCDDDCNGLQPDGETPCLFAKHHNLKNKSL